MEKEDPIGIIDSGFGGLSIYQSITDLLPEESTVYVGDHAHIPYSDKTSEYIRGRVGKLISFLLDRHVKLIVIACNTATVAGIDEYRKAFPDVPIIGVVPVIKTAGFYTKKKSFAVLSTVFTAKSTYQKKLIDMFAANCEVYNIGSHTLVNFVERGITRGADVEREIRSILPPRIISKIDVIVLGCTHYPFLRDTINAIVGEAAELLDSGGAVARQVKNILEKNNLLGNGKTTHVFFTTKKAKNISVVASKLLGKNILVTYEHI